MRCNRPVLPDVPGVELEVRSTVREMNNDLVMKNNVVGTSEVMVTSTSTPSPSIRIWVIKSADISGSRPE
jgi:hypothetical protein